MKYLHEEAVFWAKIKIKDQTTNWNNVVQKNNEPVRNKEVCEVTWVAMIFTYQREINGMKKEGFVRNDFSKITELHFDCSIYILTIFQKDPSYMLDKFLNALLNNLPKYVSYIIKKGK